MKISRRDFLKGAAVTGGAVLLSNLAKNSTQVLAAAPDANARPDGFAMLSDTTRCIGCRSCEVACNQSNNLPTPKVSLTDTSVFNEIRRTDAGAYTVVNRYQKEGWTKPIYRKQQCMHCAEPACASACLVKALHKSPEGPVIYDESLCIGCRYCMTACPFYVPTFEYNDAGSPAIQKCFMCYQKITQGGTPACAQVCPSKAITFGKRSDLIKEANTRITNAPNQYINHIYGETEAGGTDWLYISGVPFADLNLPTNVGTTAYPELTKDFLTAVPVVLVAWPALFGGIYAWMKHREKADEPESQNQEKGGAR